MKSVTLYQGGTPVIVNPAMVGAIQPTEEDDVVRTLVIVFGAKFKVRGSIEEIKAALGWKDGTEVAKPGGVKPVNIATLKAAAVRPGHDTTGETKAVSEVPIPSDDGLGIL